LELRDFTRVAAQGSIDNSSHIDAMLFTFLYLLNFALLQDFPYVIFHLEVVVFGVEAHLICLGLNVDLTHKHVFHHVVHFVIEIRVFYKLVKGYSFLGVVLNHFEDQVDALQGQVELLADINFSPAHSVLKLLQVLVEVRIRVEHVVVLILRLS
jgi:hypothetical protein